MKPYIIPHNETLHPREPSGKLLVSQLTTEQVVFGVNNFDDFISLCKTGYYVLPLRHTPKYLTCKHFPVILLNLDYNDLYLVGFKDFYTGKEFNCYVNA